MITTTTAARLNALALTVLLLGAPFTRIATAQDKEKDDKTVSFSLVGGGQFRQDEKIYDTKFQEYREVPKGALIERFKLDWNPSGKPWAISLSGRDVMLENQSYFLGVLRPGKFNWKTTYAQTPHWFSNGATSLFAGTPGNLTISTQIRQGLETAGDSGIAALKLAVDEALRASGQNIDLRSRRDVAASEMIFKVAEGFDLTVTGRNEKRKGNRALSVGTYIRRQAIAGEPGTGPGFFDAERIEPRINEMPEPYDQRSTDVGFVATLSRKRGMLSAGWDGSWFKNYNSTLYWNNPFEASPSVASSTIGLAPSFDQEPAAPFGSATLRGRFAQSAIDLWPDNTYRHMFLTGMLKLGDKSRLNATISRGRMSQNDAFNRYGENEAVVFTGVLGAPDAVYARNAPLPVSSLNGKIDTTRAEVRFTADPAEPLRLRAAYRLYDLDNKTAQIQFPGYVSAGDSYVRRGIGQTINGQKALFNTPGGYRRQVLTGGASYKAGTKITFDGDFTRTQMDYDIRQVPKNVENAIKVGARLHPNQTFTLRASYLDAKRKYEGAFTQGLEGTGIRQWDVWNRNRQQFSADADLEMGENWTLGGSFIHGKDKYPDLATGYTQPYGLNDTKNDSISMNLTYGESDWSFGAFAGYDTAQWNSLQVTKTSPTSVNNDPTNRWSRGMDDKTFWMGLNLERSLGKKTKLSADLNWNDYKGTWATKNLATPSVGSAVAYPFPDFNETFVSARVGITYDVNSAIGIETRYRYEPYRLTDFTVDQMQPYMQGVYQETGASPATLREANVSRSLFLNSRYSDYTAHVLSLLVHMRF